MVGGKIVTIQVPFLFKHLVDCMSSNEVLLVQDQAVTISGIPLALVLGYGLSRITMSGMTELRNTVFAHVAQGAIRQVGRKVFDHVPQRDMQYHLSRNTG